jgi:hypothetical protein
MSYLQLTVMVASAEARGNGCWEELWFSKEDTWGSKVVKMS